MRHCCHSAALAENQLRFEIAPGGEMMGWDVVALGLLQSAGLPLIVVITTIGVQVGQMRPDNAAGLVGAGLLSVVIFPILAMSVHAKGRSSDELAAAPSAAERGVIGN
mgnify:CR=1 FL=1